ncbi:hypothetical protein [Stappia sp. ES.058]|uniref:hypothetical protein n=1 Tax=Stappia sp. ES.058 TaxID=1881061 RepID=UPI0012FE5F54|nr:hypothetical protein [Stappia sp. ES.058]
MPETSFDGAGRAYGKRVAVYDVWRFEQLELFFKEMEEIDPEKRLPLLNGERP